MMHTWLSHQPITALYREFPHSRLRPHFDAEGEQWPPAALGKDGRRNIAPCARAKCSVKTPNENIARLDVHHLSTAALVYPSLPPSSLPSFFILQGDL